MYSVNSVAGGSHRVPVLCQFPDLLQVYLNGLQKVNIILQGFIPTNCSNVGVLRLVELQSVRLAEGS